MGVSGCSRCVTWRGVHAWFSLSHEKRQARATVHQSRASQSTRVHDYPSWCVILCSELSHQSVASHGRTSSASCAYMSLRWGNSPTWVFHTGHQLTSLSTGMLVFTNQVITIRVTASARNWHPSGHVDVVERDHRQTSSIRWSACRVLLGPESNDTCSYPFLAQYRNPPPPDPPLLAAECRWNHVQGPTTAHEQPEVSVTFRLFGLSPPTSGTMVRIGAVHLFR